MSTKHSQDHASSCAFAYSDGRHCRMPRRSKGSKYCTVHERKLRILNETDDVAAEIYAPINQSFIPASALSVSLARVFAAVASGRVSAKNATAISRVADTLLKTISASTDEFRRCYREGYWMQVVRSNFYDLPDYIPPTPPPPPARPRSLPKSTDTQADDSST
jgi:hypothetical protein